MPGPRTLILVASASSRWWRVAFVAAATVPCAVAPGYAGGPPATGEPAKATSPAPDRTLAVLADIDRIPGVQLVKRDGHQVIVSDERAGGGFDTLEGLMTIPIVIILSSAPADIPAEEFAAIGVPRPDRLAHVRSVAVAKIRRAAERGLGPLPAVGPPQTVRADGPAVFYVMQGRRLDHVPQPGEPPQVCVSMDQRIAVPIGGETVGAVFSPQGDATDRIGAELWQFRPPTAEERDAADGDGGDDAADNPAGEAADGDAAPRWVLTKPLGGSGLLRVDQPVYRNP